jgi:hypothetical protein
MRSARHRPPSASGSEAGGLNESRSRRSLADRYLGVVLIGLAILLYWSFRLMVAQWSG